MKLESLPKRSRRFDHEPLSRESGYLYFRIDPWSQDAPVYLKIPSRGTLRSIRYWLNRLVDWHDTGTVTHLR